MLLKKTVQITDCALRFASKDGSFTGYGSVFDVVDDRHSIIKPGAYADVLKSGKPVDVYVNHGWLRDELPVGRWSGLQEDARGLKGNAELVMEMRTATDAYWAMKSGLVSGLSVAFRPDPKAIEIRADGVREIHRVLELKEISIVNEPANPEAMITEVRFADEMVDIINELQSVREFERFLRDAGGLSKGAATALVARAKSLMRGEPEAEDAALSAITDRLRRLAA